MRKEIKYQEINIPASGKSGMMGGAYTIAFMYSKHNGNIVFKGYMREIEEYIKKNYTHYFVNYCLWHKGVHRDIWKFWKKNVIIWEPDPDSKLQRSFRNPYKWLVKRSKDPYWEGEVPDDDKLQYEFKRMPKRWIPEFDKL